MNIASYGGGTNSTALLIECVNRGIKIDLILFADTGGEKPHTYKYVEMFSEWLTDRGYPEIIRVKAFGKTLEQDCLDRNALPSVVYGYKSCSIRWKGQPQDKYMNNYQPAKDLWKQGGRVTKFIGYDADEPGRAKDYDDKKYMVKYPLIDWDMGRDECYLSIERAGLPLPGKSSCYFCPSSKEYEIRQLYVQYPDLAKRAIEMEDNAELTAVKGLGRNWSWGKLLATKDMFSDEFEQHIELACGCYDG